MDKTPRMVIPSNAALPSGITSRDFLSGTYSLLPNSERISVTEFPRASRKLRFAAILRLQSTE
jgi:hypothetical protein